MSVIISTGNVSHSHQAHLINPVGGLKSRLNLWKKQQGQQQGSAEVGLEATIDIETNTTEPFVCSAEEIVQKKFELSAKLFFPTGSSTSARIRALDSALRRLSAEISSSAPFTTSLILSFPEITFSDNDDDDDDEDRNLDQSSGLAHDILDVWSSASQLAAKYGIQNLGVSEFSTARLAALVTFSEKSGLAVPTVNQINIRDCCVLPPSLISLAKKSGVKLLAHNDTLDVLPVEEVPGLVGLLGVTTLDDWNWQWLLKITGVVADRGVVYSQGWIVKFAKL
ncbi:uncharacterized protein V1516DRAFT_637077 [Lipomyces oligophaga]|uniref:uncharacterized protein n=1 Tax=Lipomyces oligophaga TaxID=45792 RepID=UPI0034CE4960